jgi:hypothetical protein
VDSVSAYTGGVVVLMKSGAIFALCEECGLVKLTKPKHSHSEAPLLQVWSSHF